MHYGGFVHITICIHHSLTTMKPYFGHGHSECTEAMKNLVTAHYGEEYLEPKTFPHLFPWGFGGWHYNSPMKFEGHIKMRLYDVRGWWAHDPA